MLKSFANCFKIPELRKRIFVTLALLAVCRLMAVIPSPGIDQAGLNQVFDSLQHGQGGASSVVGMFNLFTGDALRHFAVGALGIMPYITASIIISLMTPIFPTMEKWKREGESGYQKINQFTRYLTLAICVVQGLMAAIAMENPGNIPGLNLGSGIHLVLFPGPAFRLMTVIVLTSGTMLLMWLGEQITDKGVGQGASLIITIGIIDNVPKAIYTLYDSVRGGGEGDLTPVHVFVLIGLFLLVTAATIGLTVAVRKVPIQYARMMSGRSGPGQASFFPLRVNYATIMPIIFASALLSFPPMLLGYMANQPRFSWASYIYPYFEYGSISYMFIYAALTIIFCFFWVATQFNPVQISDDLKKSGAYVPGVRPGKPTADYLDWCMTRITTAGALMLTALALLPMIFNRSLGVPITVSHFFGGTSLLIIVGVMLDTMRQVESHLMMHGYDSFLQRGRLRSRTAVGGISAQAIAQSAQRHK